MQKQKVKDSAFTFMFKQEAYIAQLYEYIAGKEIDPSELTAVKLEDHVTKPRLYNDVSFLTSKNQLLVLIEHQATPCHNMIFRILEYYVTLAGRFIKQYRLNKYGTKEIEIPKAEFWVLYNGKGIMEQLPTLDLGDVQVQARVVNIHFENIGVHNDRNNALIAYAKFIDLVENEKLDVNDAIDHLLTEGYLPEFFGRKELRNMFAEVFSYDRELIDHGFEQGVERGIDVGIERGIIQTAKKLIEKGMEMEELLEITELPSEVLESLLA